uniref:Uncharacterized protein n=1 Tax=Candidatus Kentrum sp. MB TaxID=2138164 RepID=A0A450XQ28_9GAMM|nr:MAG: hypothetical protein BECKMB1821G_GA0114241_10833 [Candidatus Kentron sp. MB]
MIHLRKIDLPDMHPRIRATAITVQGGMARVTHHKTHTLRRILHRRLDRSCNRNPDRNRKRIQPGYPTSNIPQPEKSRTEKVDKRVHFLSFSDFLIVLFRIFRESNDIPRSRTAISKDRQNHPTHQHNKR